MEITRSVKQEVDELVAEVRKCMETASTSIRMPLARLYALKAWEVRGYESWKEFLRQEFASHSTTFLTYTAEAQQLSEEIGAEFTPNAVRALRKVSKSQQDTVAKLAKAFAGDGVVEPRFVEKAAAKVLAEGPVDRVIPGGILDEAIAKICRVCNHPGIRMAIEEKVLKLTDDEIMWWAHRDDNAIIGMERLIVKNGWGPQKAYKSLTAMPTQDTRIAEGINMAIGLGGVAVVEDIGGGTSIFFSDEAWEEISNNMLEWVDKYRASHQNGP